MHRLHAKVLVWFWVGVVVVIATLVLVTQLTYSRQADDAQWQEKYGPRVDLWGQQEARALRTKGVTGLQIYVSSIQLSPGVSNYFFDETGRDILGRQPPAAVLRATAATANLPSGTQHLDTQERIIAERLVDGRGHQHVVVVDFPGPSLLDRSLLEFLALDLTTPRLDPPFLVRLVAVLVMATVVCVVLTRHISRPIGLLGAATRKLARGALHTRVDQRVLKRKDELADLGRDFDQMAERIEALVTAQRQLLGDVSHALRSPLARLNVAVGLLRQQARLTSAGHLDRIECEIDRLNTLIGQLLTMARVDAKVDLDRQTTFDLRMLAEEVAADADYEARDGGRIVQFAAEEGCLVTGARDSLRGAIENVVRNAIRHTAEGTTVELTIATQQTMVASHVVLSIRDHGPGVPQEALSRLFTPFFQVARDHGERPTGTGLGLAITRRTFEAHGGTVCATNAAEGGLVVTLLLPMHQPGEGVHLTEARLAPVKLASVRMDVTVPEESQNMQSDHHAGDHS